MTTVLGNTSRKSLVIATDLSSTQTDNLFYSTSIEMYTSTSLIISSNSVNIQVAFSQVMKLVQLQNVHHNRQYISLSPV